MRLDSYLVENGLVESRNKAQQLIKEHAVSVDGKIVDKVSYDVAEGMAVDIADTELYVSRAAIKLKGFLPYTEWELNGLRALDIGSSTGGFTQVLLENSVASVTCVDVGSDQLHPSLRSDPRVSVHENTDIRVFSAETSYDLVTCDVAFIPLELILESIDRLASKYIVLLFKPQFQVGREVKRDKNGVVKDDKAIGKAMIRLEDACALMGWKLVAKEGAHIAGKEGNQETCYGFVKG
ncbi:MAG: hemolysin [Sulfuricurvum sp. RIFOXYD2_FULL_44_160]|uniref:TlyA family rRNA (Cytidine-2'-O)-methyltransferase n=1 Tax=Sulfuricurvum kujiense TaxID=148813 RepID=A0A2D3WPM3_9BACT|nr:MULTISPECIES: TlyA family RNA methyltransferase [Sulfuricurvum]OHD91330.1 MAG: hemolysin [Sulfuricurvum sp. RIFOXYD12_FULL_44_77]OHD92181.1 MAG: hemolysin [Sulfuricurvum sp. RIFOXYD2_FULL_44_160]DAB39209.1 MAG TPA: TlyA family rRNA (cytidine-2'-O)-methyltransferase [Sulfuricurvum kujiense]